MSIRVTGPDGRVVNFPEGTPTHVIEREMDIFYGVQAEARRDRLNASTALTATSKRGAGERWADVWSNTLNTSWIAEGWRAGFNDAAEFKAAGERGDFSGSNRIILNPARIAANLVASGYMLKDGVTGGHSLEDYTNWMIGAERDRREGFAQESKEDPFWKAEGGIVGKSIHGASALTATLVGAAMDPTSYITGGSSIWAKIAIQGAVAGGIDALAQADAMGVTQDNYDIGRTGLSAAAGAGFQGIFEGAGQLLRRPGAAIPTNENIAASMREELDAADAVVRPLLTADDIQTRPLPKDMPLENVTPPKDASVPALVEQPKVDGPEVKTKEQVEAEAASKPDETKADPWNGIDWGKVGSPERAQAAIGHLDRLKTFIKPDQVERFVRWLGCEQMDVTDDATHWNKDWLDLDMLENDPDRFEEVVNVMADIFRPMYDAAGREAKTWAETTKRQTMFGITLSDAIKAHSDLTGEGGAAAKIHAIETVAIQQTDDLMTAMKQLEDQLNNGIKSSASIENVAAKLQSAALLDGMAGGAKSEIGRALNIIKMAKKRARLVNDIQASWEAMQEGLGSGHLSDEQMKEALKRIREAYGNGGAAKARDELRKIRKLGLDDYLATYIVTGYLSTPATAVRNAIGSVLHATMTVGERYVGATVGHVRRGVLGNRTSAEQVTYREANAYTAGVHQNFVDATRLAFRAFKDAKPITDGETQIGSSAQMMPFEFTAARRAKWQKGGLLAIPDMAGTALFGTLRTLGVRPTVAMDEFTKVMGRGMQLNALAVREAAYRSARLRGREQQAVFSKTLDAITNRPTAEALGRAKQAFEEIGQEFDAAKSYMGDTRLEEAADVLTAVNLQEMANDYARLLAFQKTGPTVEAFEKAFNRMKFTKALFVPFFRTPINLVRAGMIDRNPALAWVTKENRAAFGDYFRVMSEQEAALARGGAEGDMVMARMVSGIAFMSMASVLYCNGDLVGKRSKAEEEDGVKSYSIRIGGRWYGYNQLSPVAEMLGIVADMHEAWKDKDASDDQLSAMAGGVLSAITNNIVNKAALTGIGDFFDIFDPAFASTNESRADRVAKTAFKKVGDSLIPAIVRNTAWEQDPVMRQASGFIEAFKVNIPGLSESVAERRDWLGEQIVRPDNPMGLFQPMRVSKVSDDIVRREVSVLAQNDPELRLALTPPARFNGQKITPREHARVLEIQGQIYERTTNGRTMHEDLADLIQSPSFAEMSDKQRAKEIRDVVTTYRRLANQQIERGRYPELAEMVNRTGLAQATEYGEERGYSADQISRRAINSYGVSPDQLDAINNF